MGELRWAIVGGLIVLSVGIVTGQRLEEASSLERRVAKLELRVEGLVDMHLDIMKIRPGKNYEREVRRRLETFKRSIDSVDMRIRGRFRQ